MEDQGDAGKKRWISEYKPGTYLRGFIADLPENFTPENPEVREALGRSVRHWEMGR